MRKGDCSMTLSRQSRAGARMASSTATDIEIALHLKTLADDLEREGLARAPAWMREAAKRLVAGGNVVPLIHSRRRRGDAV